MTESFNYKYNKNSMLFSVPWHKNKYPESDTIIIGYINKIEDTGIEVLILDYNSIEALMPLQELSRKKVYSIRTLFKEGDIKPLLVLQVDENKGFIDLSNKYVNMAEDEINRLDRYAIVIKIFFQWVGYLTSNTNFKEKLDIDYWNKVMINSVWKFSKSEIYDILTDIKTHTLSINDAFPELVQLYDENAIIKLNKLIESHISYNIKLQITLNLVVWSIDAISIIKNILINISNLISNDVELVKTTPPVYQFIVKSTKRNYLLDLNETVTVKINELLQNYNDIKYSLNTEIIEST